MFGGIKKTDDIYKDVCFKSYSLAHPMIKYRNFNGKKEVSDKFGSATIKPSQTPVDAVKRLLRAILTSRHLESGTDITTPVTFEVIERVPVDASGKPTDDKRTKKGLKKFIRVYKGYGVKALKPRSITMKNGSSKIIKTLFSDVKPTLISKTLFKKNSVGKNIKHQSNKVTVNNTATSVNKGNSNKGNSNKGSNNKGSNNKGNNNSSSNGK